HLIKLEKKIAIGIYRQYRVTTDYAGHRRPKKLVLCCPSPHLRLTAFDKVYVLRPSSTDALRQPRAFL
ncbi:ion channel protein, partial [Toxoplasma gondii TgCatPRC2]